MKKVLTLAAFTSVALFGCNTPNHIEGRLAVTTPISVNALGVPFNQKKQITLAPASYQTSLLMQANGAEVRIHTQNGEWYFNVPQIKADAMGSFNVSAAQLGQEFAFQGRLFDSRENIDRTVSDSCVHHYDNEYKCHDENCCDDKGQNCHTEQKCDWEQVPVYGTEPVHETGYQDTKNVVVSLIKGAKASAKFSGGYTYSENIQSREVVGGCTL